MHRINFIFASRKAAHGNYEDLQDYAFIRRELAMCCLQFDIYIPAHLIVLNAISYMLQTEVLLASSCCSLALIR
jgi:hypothetical protein